MKKCSVLCSVVTALGAGLLVTIAPAMAQIDIDAQLESNVGAAPTGASEKLRAQVDSATDAAVEANEMTQGSAPGQSSSGQASDSATAVVRGKAAVDNESANYAETVNRSQVEARAESKARMKLESRRVDAQGRLEARTTLEKQQRADQAALQARLQAQPKRAGAVAVDKQSNREFDAIDRAAVGDPAVGTFDAMEVENVIDQESPNGGERLSSEARAGVQILLPGTRSKTTRQSSPSKPAAASTVISGKTVLTASEVFAKVDKDGDNQLSPEERLNASNEVQLSALYKLADSNRNGMISRAELEVALEENAGK